MKNQMIIASVILAAGLAPAATSNHQTAIETIETALQSKSAETRKDAVEALRIAGSKYQVRIEAMLQDKDSRVRLAAVAGLTDPSSLRKALDDNAPEVRFAAAKALYEMNDPAGEQALIAVLNGDSKTSSGFLAEQKREATRTMQTPKGAVVTAAKGAALLSPIPGTGLAVSMAAKAMTHRTDRAATALMLGKSNNPEAVAALEQALTDKDATVRAAAMKAIAMTDNSELARDAEPMMNDKNRTVRLNAAAAWLRLTSIESTDAE